MNTPLSRLCWVLCFAFLSSTDAFTAEAVLRGVIRDGRSGVLLPCTVEITDVNGRRVSRSAGYPGGFRCAGEFEERLPAGRTLVRIHRGFEYRAEQRVLDLGSGETHFLEVRLERQVDLRARGWYAGDSHAHMIHGEREIPVTFEDVALTARAEDLHYLSLSHAWSMEDATPEKLQTRLEALSQPDCHLTWNLEAPKNYFLGDAGRCLGHCWAVGVAGRTRGSADVIAQLLGASAADYQSTKASYANFESHALIHEQGGAVFYTHPLRWWRGAWGGQGGYPRQEGMRISNMAVELPLDVLIGPTFDGLDVITGAGEYGANAKAFELWALLLNHGYRLAATGSSDACFDRPGGAVPGVPRTYTYVPEGFRWGGVTRALAEGRNFVTTGPLLLAGIQGEPPGAVSTANGDARELRIEAWASGNDDRGLERIEVLRNGTVHRSFRLSPPQRSWSTNIVVCESETSWYCVRAFGEDSSSQRAISGAFYFEGPGYLPPDPVLVRVDARIADAKTGRLLSGTLTEVAYAGTLPRMGRQHKVADGRVNCSVPGTVRLMASVDGYQPQTLSPFLDVPEIVEFVTRLEDRDLLDWTTYERLRLLLNAVELTFALEPLSE